MEAETTPRLAFYYVARRLQTANPTGKQEQSKTDHPGPRRDWFTNRGKTEVRSNGHEEEHEADDPDSHRWSLTGIAHWIPLLNVENGRTSSRRQHT
jgi:hypothetical protein